MISKTNSFEQLHTALFLTSPEATFMLQHRLPYRLCNVQSGGAVRVLKRVIST
jgi:hypothetical protein